MYQYFITTVDRDGYYQPDPIAPDWPHISELLSDGWTLVCLFEMERQEAMALFERRNHERTKDHDNYPTANRTIRGSTGKSQS